MRECAEQWKGGERKNVGCAREEGEKNTGRNERPRADIASAERVTGERWRSKLGSIEEGQVRSSDSR